MPLKFSHHDASATEAILDTVIGPVHEASSAMYFPVSARWWQGLTTPVADGFTNETGHRTFALNELMVTPEWQGQGVAHALHDELLGSRGEERATLLVRENNTVAQTAYARWGWEKVGKLRPYPDAPHFDAMVLPLPLRPCTGRT